GGIFNDKGAMLTVSQCTLSGNTATATVNGSFGSALVEGGGIFNGGTVTGSNSTVSKNTATEGGGIFTDTRATLTVLHNSTIRGNTQDDVDNDGTLNKDESSTIGVLD